MNHYKWTIIQDTKGFYHLLGYVFVDGKWSVDGAPLTWSYVGGALEHIRKQEIEKSKVSD